MYRCGDFSDSESDIEEHNRCFNFNTQNLFKRKHSDDDAMDKDGKIISKTDVIPSKIFKNWFHKNAAPSTDVNESQNANDFDPTYGFAKQLENRTYFRNNNVDTSIPMDCLGVDQYQDILYPLRTSTGSNDSSNSGHYKTDNGGPTGNTNSPVSLSTPNASSGHYKTDNGGLTGYTKSPVSVSTPNVSSNIFMSSVGASRKRVQFDERSNKVNVFRRHPQYQYHSQQRTKGYLFNPQPDNAKLTLRQRITNFFSNLF